MGSADYVFKIGVIGDSKVGKTSFIFGLTSKAFMTDYEPTKQPETLVRKIISSQNEVSLKCEIIDTSGRDKFLDLLPLYLKRVDAIIVCYDVTDCSSFRNIDKWLCLPCLSNCTVRVIVGCKSDLEGDQAVTEIMVSEKLQELAGIKAFEVSAKENQGISSVFRHIHTSLHPAVNRRLEERRESVVISQNVEEPKQKKCLCKISS